MPENKHLGTVGEIYPVGSTCPICETPILLVHKTGTYWLACDCMAEEFCTTDEAKTLDVEDYRISGEEWAKEVAQTMNLFTEQFSPDALPGPVDLDES